MIAEQSGTQAHEPSASFCNRFLKLNKVLKGTRCCDPY